MEHYGAENSESSAKVLNYKVSRESASGYCMYLKMDLGK